MSKRTEEENHGNDLTLVLDRYSEAVRDAQDYLTEVEEARHFYSSNQWLVHTKGGRWVAPKKSAWRVRLTINKIMPAVDSLVSMFLRIDPVITTDPATNEDVDRKASEISKKLCRYNWRTMKMKKKTAKLVRAMCVDGNAWLRSRWNPLAGRKFPRFEDGTVEEYVPGVMVSDPKIKEWMPEGGNEADVLLAGSVFLEPGAAELDDAGWVMVIESLRRSELEKRFDKELEGEKLSDDDLIHPTEFNPIFEPRSWSLSYTGQQDKRKERVILYQMYERPTKEHPLGRIVYCTNGRWLRTDPLPKGEIRIVQVTAIELLGEKYGTGPTTQAVPIQAEYNKTRSQIVEDRRLMGRPKVLAPIGALEDDELDSKPGQIVEWDPIAAQGVKPEIWKGPGTSQSVFQEMAVMDNEISDLMSRHDPSQGALTGATSGKHAQTSIAADNSRFGPAMWNLEQALGEFFRYTLGDYRENATGKKTISITGENMPSEVLAFNAIDVTDECNIEIRLVSQLEWSKEQLRQTAMWLHSQGILDAEQLRSYLNLPMRESLYETNLQHRLNARRENLMLNEGPFPPPATDDHMTHIVEHMAHVNMPEKREDLIKTFRETGGEWPQWFVNCMMHLEQHKKSIPPPPPAPIRKSISLRGEMAPQTAEAIAEQGLGQPQVPGREDGQSQPSGKPKGVATPPGGLSGEAYVATGPAAGGVEAQDAGLSQ